MKKIFLFLAVVIMAIGTFNCKKDSQKIIGSWTRTVQGYNYTLTFSDGGTFTASAGSSNHSGSYSLSGKEITFINSDCGSSSGRYTFSVSKKTLSFSTISDNCSDRSEVLAGDWSKQ